ncbi:MAG: LysM peptidoglycan-binding domain-containing protein [Lachnospiraceae bacterium]|nr:LysM peptidoglycan-binding domain-containing protein [Lachnospiraceae bacterium]
MIYVVVPGDNVDSIAAAFGISAEQLVYDNQIAYPYALAVGQALYIRNGYDRTRSINVNGYAYPFINEEILDETLEYLDDLSIFSYGFTAAGELIPPFVSDDFMIEAANESGVRAILTLTPFDVNGQFNNNLISAVVNNPKASENLIEELLTEVSSRGFGGVDVDFEFILADDRDNFTTFVARLTERMNENGYTVSVALAPKVRADQPGLLYEGKDYGGLGVAANSVLLMTYEWGYTYSQPMAVAPINRVREVVEYAVTEIPVAKIDLGIPNYGYDWPLPYERGVTKARTIGNIEAIEIAVRYGATIIFDETAQSPFFNYQDDTGVEHEVWFEDVRSMRAKFALVSEYNLRGVGYWQLMRLFRANWLLLSDTFIL